MTAQTKPLIPKFKECCWTVLTHVTNAIYKKWRRYHDNFEWYERARVKFAKPKHNSKSARFQLFIFYKFIANFNFYLL